MTLRPSRIAAVAIIAVVVASISNCGKLAFGFVNAPARVGWYERNSNLGIEEDSGIRYVIHLSFTP